MKPELGDPFLPGWKGYPPAMPTGDYEIWFRYRQELVGMFDEIFFNVRIGEPTPFPADTPPEMIVMVQALSRRRIDVAARNKDHWLLVELKLNAGTEALGQILLYKALWELDPPDHKPVSLAIVSDRANKDLILGCKYYNVSLIVV